jgi:uncharacterized damage-inducible protein DinB
MKDLLFQYAQYNCWANKKLFDRISKLSDEQIHTELPSSFSTLYKTAMHIAYADDMWWQRLMLVENPKSSYEKFEGNFSELVVLIQKQAMKWEEWIGKAKEVQLNHVFWYNNSKSEQFRQPVFQMMLHIFNHSTFHRGQMVNMLRQLGITDIPQTDFIFYSRTRKVK